MAYARVAVVFALLLHATCLSPSLGVLHIRPLSEAPSARYQLKKAKAPGKSASTRYERLASIKRSRLPYAPATLSARRARHAWWTCRLPSPPPLPLFRPLPSPSAPLSPPPAVCPSDIVCPSGASCAVGSVGFPFCKCPVGQAIINGACGPAASWSTVGTNVVLYTRASFANDPGVAPAVLRAPPPNTSACVNIPFAFQGGHVGSLRIMWNVDDGAPDHLVCGKVVFWAYGDCVGSSQVVEIPGKWMAAKPDNFKYATTSYKKTFNVLGTGGSISCLAATLPPVSNLCDTPSCPGTSLPLSHLRPPSLSPSVQPPILIMNPPTITLFPSACGPCEVTLMFLSFTSPTRLFSLRSPSHHSPSHNSPPHAYLSYMFPHP
ncbi:unnamed protein product [Closterium sp. Naga37s-1]|nr:unnamed protein product [Closterium sp. Naga37s-1]